MTSKGNTGCFVYITLPGETDSVTAGRFELTTDRRGNALGRFVYGKSYLARGNAVAIDPVELKLAEGTYETVRLNGVFGALRDSGPDYWGRRVIEKHAGVAPLGELDYLLHSADDRAGALGFGLNLQPPAPRRTFNTTLELARLQEIAQALMREQDVRTGEAAQVQDLLLIGTSMGGARPKAVVEDQEGCGSRSSIAPTIAGTTPASSTRCLSSPEAAVSALPPAASRPSPETTFFWSGASTGNKPAPPPIPRRA